MIYILIFNILYNYSHNPPLEWYIYGFILPSKALKTSKNQWLLFCDYLVIECQIHANPWFLASAPDLQLVVMLGKAFMEEGYHQGWILRFPRHIPFPIHFLLHVCSLRYELSMSQCVPAAARSASCCPS